VSSAAFELTGRIETQERALARKRQIVVDPVGAGATYRLPHSGLHLGESIIVVASTLYVDPFVVEAVSGDAINLETSVRLGSDVGEWVEFASAVFPFVGVPRWWVVGHGSFRSGTAIGWSTVFPATLESAASSKYKTYRYKNLSTVASVVVNTNGVDLIVDTGTTSVVLPPLGWVSLYSDGTQWLIVG
jgi:hypothetical protein